MSFTVQEARAAFFMLQLSPAPLHVGGSEKHFEIYPLIAQK